MSRYYTGEPRRSKSSYANRGLPFEELIEIVNAQYRAAGIACLEKIPTRFIPIRNEAGKIVDCKVEKKSCVDYLGRYRSIPVAVEAKHTEEQRIRFDRVEPHQRDFLRDYAITEGAVSFVFVSFSLSRFFVVPAYFWLAAERAWKVTGKKKQTVTRYGYTWNTPGAASVSPGELLPQWEVFPARTGSVSLPYLNIIGAMDLWGGRR